MIAGLHRIGGRWLEGGGAAFGSADPSSGEVLWKGRAATALEVDRAVAAARESFPGWARRSVAERHGVLEAFGEELRAHREELAHTVSRETGKPRWESAGEVDAMVAKIALTHQAHAERCVHPPVDLGGGAVGGIRFRPHGVLAVLGPFNLPAHLPNGHIVPALLSGNTVVFKPSEHTPLVAQKTVELWEDAGLPGGVLNLVHGAAETGGALADHEGIDGLLFTGSYRAGSALHRTFAGRPERLLALEMGGNNPLVVWGPGDPDAAAVLTVLSAFITAGQRCTCTRRLVVEEGRGGEAFLGRLVGRVGRLRVGRPADRPEPFLGPLISTGAAEAVLEAQADLVRRGGRTLVEARRGAGEGAFVTPGIVDVTGLRDLPDHEVFGPLLQVVRVPDFESALGQANGTAYGLAAGLLTDDRGLFERFVDGVQAGVLHWNRPTTGASGRLPFGGLGRSGNHRPSGYYAVDYCGDPVAVVEADTVRVPASLPPGVEA